MSRLLLDNWFLKCISCNEVYEPNPWLFKCPKCSNLLSVAIDLSEVDVSWRLLRSRIFNVWRYRELLPVPREFEVVSLGEGGTPLIELRRLPKVFGIECRVFLKFEGCNPTGSFKDRGMTVGVTIAKNIGVEKIMVASTGNTAASAAAYAARAGLKCLIYLPKGKVAKGKLAQAILHGAEIIEVEGSFDEALSKVLGKAFSCRDIYPLNSFNPWRLEGQKTIAYEVADVLGDAPDVVVVPVGNAGNISAIWKGFKELYELGLISKLPRMIGVQASGAAPLARAWKLGLDKPLFIDSPETIATAIRIGRPINWLKAWKAVKESKGMFVEVEDKEITYAQRILARLEGIAVEPASAVTIASLNYIRDFFDKDEIMVLIATGHGLKDPDIILKQIDKEVI